MDIVIICTFLEVTLRSLPEDRPLCHARTMNQRRKDQKGGLQRSARIRQDHRDAIAVGPFTIIASLTPHSPSFEMEQACKMGRRGWLRGPTTIWCYLPTIIAQGHMRIFYPWKVWLYKTQMYSKNFIGTPRSAMVYGPWRPLRRAGMVSSAEHSKECLPYSLSLVVLKWRCWGDSVEH